MCPGTFESRIPMCLIARGQDVAAHLVLLLSVCLSLLSLSHCAVSPHHSLCALEEITTTGCILTAEKAQ